MTLPSRVMAKGGKFRPRARISRLAIALLTLLAFTAQTIVTQTHIHAAVRAGNATAPALASDTPRGPLPGKAPAGDDQANCPICQGLLHAGAYVTPSSTAVMLSTVATFINVVVIEVVAIAQAHSHAWQGRAPPPA